MNLSEVNNQAENLEKKSKNAILKLIDIKTNSDMKEVLNKLDSMNARITTLYWLFGVLAMLMSVFKFLN